MKPLKQPLIIKNLQSKDYEKILHDMQTFTENRNESTLDELWILEHYPVFTLGQSANNEHLLSPSDIPIVRTDRGGQVTYHGPGQLVIYFLLDIERKGMGVRDLVNALEDAMIALLNMYGITGHKQGKARGVFVQFDNIEAKIGSIGLRIKRGRSYHGLSFNIDMDLSPFLSINPCGFSNLKIVQLKDFIRDVSIEKVKEQLTTLLVNVLNYEVKY